MKIKSKAILFVILSQLLCLVNNAQEMRIIKGKPGEIFMLPEVALLFNLEDKKILVENVMPKDMRDKNYKNVDLQEKDEILMVNGKKIKTPKDCEDIYDKLKVGEEFKMGIGRNDKMFIVSFKKADPEKLKSGGRMVVKMNDKDEDIRVLPEFGIVLSGSKGKVTIKEAIKEIPNTEGKDAKSGDLVLKINDKEIKNLTGRRWGIMIIIKTGRELTLSLQRDNKEIVISAEKLAA